MEKIWLRSYPPGVPHDINPDSYSSLVELFDQSCKKFANLPAFYNLGIAFTFQQVEKYSRYFAAYLQQELKLTKGSRIAIMLPNILQYPIVMFGALRAGLTVVNVNPLYTEAELTIQLKDSGAETIIVLANFANTVQKALVNTPNVKNVIVTKIGDFFSLPKSSLMHFILKYIKKKIPNWSIPQALSFKKILREGQNHTFLPVTLKSADIAFLQYTGGTTGTAKGAMLTHRNLLSNILQANAWFNPILEPGKEIIITALPLYHIFSLTANCLFFFSIGALNVLIANPRDIPHMIADMEKFKFTAITGVNTLYNALLKNSQFAKLDFRKLKISLGGGMAVQEIVAQKWQKMTGVPISEAYGLTETSPCVTMNPYTMQTYNHSIGLPVPSTEIKIVDDDRHEMPIGTPGELMIRGPQVMLGYWNNQPETEKIIKDGWLLSGDIGSMDEAGYFRILERKKDMILVSGFNVYPNEIEDVLVKIPGVVEAAVVGISDEKSGEAVKAFLVKDDPHLSEDDVLRFCHRNLTGYKIPKSIEFCEELPKSAVGKILRRSLRKS